MRVLLDEDLPHKLRLHLPGHDIATASYQGWSGLKNGALLRATEEAGFDVFVTGDKKLRSQQNLSGRKLAVIVLCEQEWPSLRLHLAEILEAIDAATPGSFCYVEWAIA